MSMDFRKRMDIGDDPDIRRLRNLKGKLLRGTGLAKVRESLAEKPELWQEVEDASLGIREEALQSIRDDSVRQECVLTGIEEMRKSLMPEHATPMERMAVEQVVTCWVQTGLTGHRMESCFNRPHGLNEGSFWEKQYHRSHLRLTRSLALLAAMKRLSVGGRALGSGERESVRVAVCYDGESVPFKYVDL